MGFLFGFPIFCIVMWFWLRGNAFTAFSLGLFLTIFGTSWRWWLDPSQYDQAGWTAWGEGAATAFAITCTPWMIRGLIRWWRTAPLQHRQLVHPSQRRIRA